MHTLPILTLLKHILSQSSSTLFPLLTPSNYKSVYDQSKGFLKPSLKIIIFSTLHLLDCSLGSFL